MTRLAIIALLALTCLTFAGCSDPPSDPSGDTTTETLTSTQSDAIALLVTLEQPTPTEADSITLRGTVSKPAAISVIGTDGDGGDAIYISGNVQANGTWNVTLQGLRYGHTPVEVFADDGSSTALATATVVRLASATFEAIYTGSPSHGDSTDLVWYDPGTLASASMYDGTGTEHPPQFTVHDLMVVWTNQTATAIEYSGPGAFGFGVNKIDGVGQPLDASFPPYWCYTRNGESADLGITLQTVAPDDVVRWEYSTCVV